MWLHSSDALSTALQFSRGAPGFHHLPLWSIFSYY